MTCPDCFGQLEIFEREPYCPDCLRFEPVDDPPAQNGCASDGSRASGTVSSDSGTSRHPRRPRQNKRTTR